MLVTAAAPEARKTRWTKPHVCREGEEWRVRLRGEVVDVGPSVASLSPGPLYRLRKFYEDRAVEEQLRSAEQYLKARLGSRPYFWQCLAARSAKAARQDLSRAMIVSKMIREKEAIYEKQG